MPLDLPHLLYFMGKIDWCLSKKALDIFETLIESQFYYLLSQLPGQITLPLREKIYRGYL